MPVTCAEMQAFENAVFARGVSAFDLMEEAGTGIAKVIRQFYPRPGLAVLYLGKGNNGGDALVTGRELQKHGWKIAARLACEPDLLKPLPLQHWQKLMPERWQDAAPAFDFAGPGPLLLLDGLLGIGAKGELRGTMRELADEMNRLREEWHATTVAMDLPSGLDGDTGIPGPGTVIADLTTTVAQVKRGLLADSATAHVGRLAVVPVKALNPTDEDESIITARLLRSCLPRRRFDMHKGKAGRVALIAGSRGYLGAAVLTALGALRGGAGLITLLAHERDYELLAAKLPPEVMVKPVLSFAAARRGYDVIAVGPGLGDAYDDEVLALIQEAEQPMVVDADGLNALSRHGIPVCAGPRLLTPHPGEMARLCAGQPKWQQLDRKGQAEVLASTHRVTLLLKGARTVIASPHDITRYNTTGTPGMACGGMGDVLTGLCAALIAQGMDAHDAACAGSWLIGRAAEMVLTLGLRSEEALSATDVAEHLGEAFQEIREGGL